MCASRAGKSNLSELVEELVRKNLYLSSEYACAISLLETIDQQEKVGTRFLSSIFIEKWETSRHSILPVPGLGDTLGRTRTSLPNDSENAIVHEFTFDQLHHAGIQRGALPARSARQHFAADLPSYRDIVVDEAARQET